MIWFVDLAQFCVAFVEAFAAQPWPLLSRNGCDVEDALTELSTAQEAATAEELMERMQGYVDPATARYFQEEAVPVGASSGRGSARAHAV